MNASVMAFAMFLGNLSSPVSIPEEPGQTSAPTTYQVAYSNTLVDFSMHNQQIVQDSICQNFSELSIQQQQDCQTHARLMFSETCNKLSAEKSHPYKKTFCETAYTLLPGASGIGLVSNKQEDPSFLARQQCSEYTLRAQRTGSGAHLALRDQACKKARRLSAVKRRAHTLAGNI